MGDCATLRVHLKGRTQKGEEGGGEVARATKAEKEAQERRDAARSLEAETLRKVGARISQARKEAGVTQRQLGDHLVITETMVSNIERGIYSPYKYLDKISSLVHKDREWFLGAEEPTTPEVLARLDEVMSKLDEVLVMMGEMTIHKPVHDGKTRSRKTLK